MKNKILSRDQLIKYLYLMFDEQAAVELAEYRNFDWRSVPIQESCGIPKTLKELAEALRWEPRDALFRIKKESSDGLIFAKQPTNVVGLSQNSVFCWIVGVEC